jgi:hypothetical protein
LNNRNGNDKPTRLVPSITAQDGHVVRRPGGKQPAASKMSGECSTASTESGLVGDESVEQQDTPGRPKSASSRQQTGKRGPGS